ncbi:reverse transcriptase domain-containing protein [Tanacetum coccineum]
METVFRISNCSVENQIKFSTCTLLAGALTWWNSHVMIVSHDVAYVMTWTDLKKKMRRTVLSRERDEVARAESWNLKFERMFPEESDKIEMYVSGLPDMIHSSVMASKPKTMQNVAQAYAVGTGERKEYARTLPLSTGWTNNQRTLTCYECGNQGHYRSDCPELKNGNQAGGAGKRGMVLALVGGETNQDLDDMEDNTYA